MSETHTGDDTAVTGSWRRLSARSRRVVVGGATFLAEYGLLALAVLVGPSTVHSSDPVEVAVVYGHLLFNAHNVPTRFAGADRVVTVNTLYAAADPSVPPALYLLIPIVALLLAGLVVGWRHEIAPDRNPLRTAAGAARDVALGYAAVAAVAALAFVRAAPAGDGSGTMTVTTHRPLAVVATALYALAFGFLGAAAVLLWRQW